MRRVTEVFDCWFESGSMPYAQNHYPFENKDAVEASLPAEYIAEGLDQTRGWFYTLTVLSTALFDRPAFQNVIVNGIVLAEDGEKMSKSKRNFPDPSIVLEKYGADALRLYLIDSPVMNAKDLRFQESGVQERIRAVMLPLWNAYSFLTKYADVHGWAPDGVAPDPLVNDLDGWVLSRLQTLVGTVEEHMGQYQLFRVVPALVGFVDELTNWYIRLGRRRFWNAEDSQVASADGLNAYRTLHHVLLTLSKALAPFLPFISEEIFTNLSEGKEADSVHLMDYPVVNAAWLDPALELRMSLSRRAVGLGRSLRAKHGVKVRQCLGTLTVVSHGEDDRAALEAGAALLAAELNVKQVVVSADESALVTYSARPNLKLLGPRFGKQLGVIRCEVEALTSEELAGILAGRAVTSASVEGLEYDQATLLVDRSSREGTVTETEEGVTVALDLTITPELRREGLAREVINRVQNLRKDSGLAFDDRIKLDLASADEELAGAIREHWEVISSEVLAEHALPDLSAAGEAGADMEIDGAALTVALQRVEPV